VRRSLEAEMVALRRLVVAATGVALSLALAGPPAHAAAPSAYGYWWRLQTGSGPSLPPPPVVPSGGLWVAVDVSGQQAVSAVRFKAARGDEIRSLVLTVARSSGQGAVMLACPARSSWQAVEAGDWATRPQTACDVAFVKGVASADGSSWSFDVRGLARSGTLDVVILPPPDATSTFSVAFDRPSSASIVTRSSPGSPSPPGGGTSPPGSPSSTPSARVLADKTTSPTSSPSEPSPSSGSPSNGFLPNALEPFAHAGRAVWPLVVAVLLALGVLGGRALISRRR
jgi:hypothetical protein